MAELPTISPSDTDAGRRSQSAIDGRQLPELLAPAGDWECAKAAVENGADAIYFALEKFNARIRATNFTEADLPELMEFLHRRGVCGYGCLNTLVFENELAEAEQQLRAMITAGVDAVLVQDVGIARLVRKISPDFPMHASTQMTITSAAGVEFARELGCNLVVLARECSIAEIEKIQAALGWAGSPLPAASHGNDGAHGVTRPTEMSLEIFVHGALCVAYSGQCLTSEALGGRSANRGECAQACRMPYELISDGKLVPLGDRRYLLSPQDLVGLELLPDLIRTGVASLKIEGRLKTPEYVANITRIYRQALNKVCHRDAETQSFSVGQRDRYEMEMAFSRGLYTGWFRGINNQELVHGRFGKKRGVFLGEVTRVLRDAVIVRLEGPLKRGDGIVFDAGKPEEKEEGGRVYRIQKAKGKRQNGQAELRFGRGNVDFARVQVGDKVWKTSDPELNCELRQRFEGNSPKFQRPLHVEIHGRAGQPLTLMVRDDLGHVAKIESSMPLTVAETQPLTNEKLREQLGRLGGTPFKLSRLTNDLAGEVMLPVSELNRLRREAVLQLESLRAKPKRWALVGKHSPAFQNSPSNRRENGDAVEHVPTAQLIALVRNLAQLEAALKCGVETVYCDFENPKRYRDAVAVFHTSYGCRDEGVHGVTRPMIWVAPPRVFKPDEKWILDQVRSCSADGYLVRNYDHLQFFTNDRRIGDYSLNVANRLAADYFKNRFGLERLTVSYDLNFQQLEALLQAAPPEWFEVTIHQHMPMFHMEHCVFCAFLSSGKDYRDCGRPCDVQDVKLRDRVGAEHPVKADVGCRNTVFNSLAQTGAEFVERMLALGVRHFRVEFVNETPEQVTRTITKYRQLLRGEISGSQLWRELKLFNQLGVTRGQMAV